MFINISVERDGLRPLAACAKLKHLTVPNQFPTADYAYLSALMPQVECDLFAPWVPRAESGGHDVMVVGRRKPFLHSVRDRERITRYEREFEALRRDFLQAGRSVE